MNCLENSAGVVRGKLNKQLPVRAWSLFVRFIAPVLVLLTFLFSAGMLDSVIDWVKKICKIEQSASSEKTAPEKK